MFQLDLKSRKSICDQIVDNLKELIISEVLRPDDKLPSVRELSRTLTINPNTVQKAYKILEEQDFIYVLSGLGTFVAEIKNRGIDKAQLDMITQKISTDIKELFFLGLSKEEVEELIAHIIEEGGFSHDKG